MRKKLKKRSFFDRFSYSNRNTNIFLVSTFLILLFCLTIGYSTLSNVLSIKGDIAVRPTKDIRITNITGPTMTNGAYENTNFRFSHDLLSVNGVLPNDNSTLTYTITIKNNGTSDMDLTDIINTCNDSNIYYELSGISLGDTIEAGTSITFTLTLKTSSGSNNAFNCQLKFVFEQSYMDITAPEITFEPIASNTCNSSSFDVTVIATDDIEVKTFLWCQTTGNNSSCTPTNIVESNQKEVSKVITINTDDKYHVICVQAVDGSKYGPNFNIKCSNSDGNYYSLETTGPVITVDGNTSDYSIEVQGKTSYTVPTGTATDNCGENLNVTTSGNVNTSLGGTYTIDYTATDSAGNTTTLTLIVKVVGIYNLTGVCGDKCQSISSVTGLASGNSANISIDADYNNQTKVPDCSFVDTDTGETLTIDYDEPTCQSSSSPGGYENTCDITITMPANNVTATCNFVEKVSVTGTCGNECASVETKSVAPNSIISIETTSNLVNPQQYDIYFSDCTFKNANTSSTVLIPYTKTCNEVNVSFSYRQELSLKFKMSSYPIKVTCNYSKE